MVFEGGGGGGGGGEDGDGGGAEGFVLVVGGVEVGELEGGDFGPGGEGAEDLGEVDLAFGGAAFAVAGVFGGFVGFPAVGGFGAGGLEGVEVSGAADGEEDGDGGVGLGAVVVSMGKERVNWPMAPWKVSGAPGGRGGR